MAETYKYTAFISYNSKDNHKAKWLQNKLEHYNLPSVIANEKGEIIKSYDEKPKTFRIFRYVTDLVAQNLDDGLRKELDLSRYLIVICSPNSANAPWVRKEVKHFVDTGRKKQIIPFVIKGTPYSNDDDECFTPELKEAFPTGSALGVNLNDYGDDLWFFRKRKAVAKMVSLLIDLPNAYDFIWNRYRVSYIKSIIIKIFIFIFGILAIVFSVAYVKYKEKPFDMYVEVVETNNNPYLSPLNEIEISISIENDNLQKDTLASLNDKAVFAQKPGRMMGKPMRLIARNADCYEVDTVLSVQKNIIIPLQRNPLIYGRIDCFILKDQEVLCNQVLSVENIRVKTNSEGKLEMEIPFHNQKDKYDIRYEEYCGTIQMPCVGTPCIILKK